MGDKCERAKKRHRLWLLIWFTICLNFGQSALTDPAIQEVNVQRKNGKSNKLFFSLLLATYAVARCLLYILHFFTQVNRQCREAYLHLLLVGYLCRCKILLCILPYFPQLNSQRRDAVPIPTSCWIPMLLQDSFVHTKLNSVGEQVGRICSTYTFFLLDTYAIARCLLCILHFFPQVNRQGRDAYLHLLLVGYPCHCKMSFVHTTLNSVGEQVGQRHSTYTLLLVGYQCHGKMFMVLPFIP